MDNDALHSFDICPLRSSSSLFIIDRRDQCIVTATDELFDMLGYEASEIIGQPVDQLLTHTRDSTVWTARHARGGRLSLQVCIHHNPLQTTTELDYWLVRPRQAAVCRRIPYAIRTTTILLLSPVGIIDRVYHINRHALLVPAPAHHQQQLVGKPVMAYIHSDDVQTLCGQLSTVYRDQEPSFDVRWLHQRDNHTWQRVTLTATKTSTRITCVIERRAAAVVPAIVDAVQQWAVESAAHLLAQWQQSRRYLLEFVDHATSSKNQHGWYSSIVQVIKNIYPPDGILTMLEDWVDRAKASRPSFL